MTLGEFAYLLAVDPKWVQNAAAALGGLRFSLPVARRLAVARALIQTLETPLPRAYALAARMLRSYPGGRAPVSLSLPEDPSVTVTIDVYRVLSGVSAGMSRLRTQFAPRRRGRPANLRDPIRAAEAYGLDLGLLRSNLRLTPVERLRQLDAMAEFRRRVRHEHV